MAIAFRTFGQALRQEREARGWSQRYLAALLGVGERTLQSWENEETNDPGLSKVLAAGRLFGWGLPFVDGDEATRV